MRQTQHAGAARGGRMTRWIARLEEARGTLPVALIAHAVDGRERRRLLTHLAAAVLRRDPREVVVAHASGRPPALVEPAARLFLSSASRDGWAALAVADRPVGIDIERVEPGLEIPWRVLHEAEARWLRGVPERRQPASFARLWTVKEAYLKALGKGLARSPETFRVACDDERLSVIEDPVREDGAIAETVWCDSRLRAVSVVLVETTGSRAG